MKSKVVKTLLSVSVAASMALTVPSAAWASQADAETASEETAEEEPQDIAVALEEGNLTITNQTTRTFTEAQLKEEAAQETDASKEAAQAGGGQCRSGRRCCCRDKGGTFCKPCDHRRKW